jgi:peptidoglycan hydrolase-like protein with peptidoglycan-binding domain
MKRVAGLVAAGFLLLPGPAVGAGEPDVAALQVALHTHGVYRGTIDGLRGRATTNALVAFQRRAGLAPDGLVGPATRAALGGNAGLELGARPLAVGASGWDVAELQFVLAWHGFPSGTFDGVFGPHLLYAVMRFQRFARLPAIGVVGSRTIAALQLPPPRCPLALRWPVTAPVGDRFGPRGMHFHPGIDILASLGTPIGAARAGTVTWAGPADGYGNLVVLANGQDVRTLYAHLAQLNVRVGQRVAAGQQVGVVGATGDATGPHLHFEVRVRGAAMDPLSALP